MCEPKREALGNGIHAVAGAAHGFGLDALLLADFAKPKQNETACDLGSGCGILPLLWCREAAAKHIHAVELQKEACALLRQAVQENQLQSRISVHEADLRDLRGILPAGQFDLVTMNPPYFAAGSGGVSKTESAKLARHEASCTLAEICAAGTNLLRFGGRLALCCRTERLFELMQAMEAAGAAPKRLRLVAKNTASAPGLALVEARRGGKPGLQMENILFVHEADGGYTSEMKRIYGTDGERP